MILVECLRNPAPQQVSHVCTSPRADDMDCTIFQVTIEKLKSHRVFDALNINEIPWHKYEVEKVFSIASDSCLSFKLWRRGLN